MTHAPNPQTSRHGWLYRRIVLPVLALLRLGATPERLAWSLAVGILIGINPILGSTTVACLAVAWTLRLNLAASQLTNHIVYPLQIVLLLPFLRAGARAFHTAAIPLSASELLRSARSNPVALSRQLWTWEWHALVLWAVLAAVLTPMLAAALTPILRRLLARIERRQYPIVPV